MSRAMLWFLAVSFGFSWTVAEVYYRVLPKGQLSGALMAIVFMYGPALGAVAAVRFGLKQPLSWLGPIWRWRPALLLAFALPLLFAVAHVALAAILPGLQLQLDTAGLSAHILQSIPADQQALASEQLAKMGDALALVLLAQTLIGAVIAGATINALVSFGEELGWRGFLHKQLGDQTFWQRSLGIGVLWGIWHAPLILRGHNYPEHPVAGVGMMVLFCVLWSPLFEWVREKSQSVIAATVMHGTLNATAGTMVFVQGSDLLKGPAGLAGMLVLVLANGLLWWQQRRQVSADALRVNA